MFLGYSKKNIFRDKITESVGDCNQPSSFREVGSSKLVLEEEIEIVNQIQYLFCAWHDARCFKRNHRK